MYQQTKPLPQDKNKNPLEVGDQVNISVANTMGEAASSRNDDSNGKCPTRRMVEPVRVKMTNMIHHFESNKKEVDFIGFKVMKEDLPMPSIILKEVFEFHPEFGNSLMKMGHVMRASSVTFDDEEISFLVGIMAMDC
jgi:hypothetical protein